MDEDSLNEVQIGDDLKSDVLELEGGKQDEINDDSLDVSSEVLMERYTKCLKRNKNLNVLVQKQKSEIKALMKEIAVLNFEKKSPRPEDKDDAMAQMKQKERELVAKINDLEKRVGSEEAAKTKLERENQKIK